MVRNWHDPRIPDADTHVLANLLEKYAATTPERTMALFQDGASWTFAQALEITRRTASGLQALGVKQGDHVNVWLPNGKDNIAVWFAINYLGAIYVPINLAYKGRILEHVLANAGAKLIVAHADLIDRLSGVSTARLTDAVVIGGDATAVEGLRMHGADLLSPDHITVTGHPVIAPWDTQTVIYTSGTTGPSKGVLVSYLQVLSAIEGAYGFLTGEDRFLVNLPLFHVSGAGAVMISLVTGGSFVLVDSFNTSQFWNVVRETGSTTVVLLGIMANFLVKQPPGPADRDHTLRSVMMVPLSENAQAFRQRFGCDVYTVFNMTEISSPLFAGPNPGPISSCGRPRPGVECRLVDDNDCEVAPGETGELILRTDRPWAMTQGYLNNPEATARAWRNGWFHTGDAFRVDETGNYFFIDRMKDAIRRRGENISSFEVEIEVCAHPAVREAAAVAVPSEFGEDEVLVVVAPAPGQQVDPAELLHFLAGRMPYFMAPRYIRVLDDLPKTPTQKVQKHLLRDEGVTQDTFDREKAGIHIRRDRIGAAS